MTWTKCSLSTMVTDTPPSYQERPAEMVRKHTHTHMKTPRAGTSSHTRYGILFDLLSGIRTSGLLPRGVRKEVRSSCAINLQNKPANSTNEQCFTVSQVLLEKQHLSDPFSQALGIRKQLRKRTGNNECFWKYCV